MIRRNNNSRLIYAALFSTLVATGCGGKTGGGSATPVPVPVASPEAQVEPVVETPIEAFDLKTMTFIETNIDLIGDFRVKKVERDAKGHYYVALVSDVKVGATSTPGYALMKFDESGKELWRFPTFENTSTNGGTASSERAGSFLLGALADFHVTPLGEIWTIGIKQAGVNMSASTIKNLAKYNLVSPLATSDQATVSYRMGNVVFLSHIVGSGVTPDAPKALSYEQLAAPTWWQPLSIRVDSTNAIAIESASGPWAAHGGVTQQVQLIAPDFSKVVNSVCYVAAVASASSGEPRLINLAVAAPAELIAKLPGVFTAAAAPAAVPTAAVAIELARAAVSAASGGCWDLIGATFMPKENPKFIVNKPTALAAGQEIIARVESLSDLLNGTKAFEEYDISNLSTAGSEPWIQGIAAGQSQAFEKSYAQCIASGNELIYIGLSSEDIIDNNKLFLGNGRSTAGKAWSVDLITQNGRSPGSFDILDAKGVTGLFAAWTDVHQPGETNEGNRGLHLAQIDPAHPETFIPQEFEAPITTGHSSFSSVRLADGPGGKIAVFATVGTRNHEFSADNAQMQQATLIIGFTK